MRELVYVGGTAVTYLDPDIGHVAPADRRFVSERDAVRLVATGLWQPAVSTKPTRGGSRAAEEASTLSDRQ